MVKQAVRQTYTYYDADHPQGDVVEDRPLEGKGRAWTLGSYRHPVYPSPLDIRVGDAGLKVWMVIDLVRSVDDLAALLSRYRETLTREDVEVAEWFYRQHKEAIDRKLEEERVEA